MRNFILLLFLAATPTLTLAQIQDFSDNNFNQQVQLSVQNAVNPPPTEMVFTSAVHNINGKRETITTGAQKTAPITINQIFARYNFSDTNSRLGGGITTANGTEAGINLATAFNLSCIGTFGYSGPDTDKPNGSRVEANNYSGDLFLEQGVYSWPSLEMDKLAPTSAPPAASPTFPSFNLYLGLDSKYTSANQTLYATTGYKDTHQDIYDLGPSIRYQISTSEKLKISLLAQYAYEFVDQRAGTSTNGSSGIFSLGLRPVYLIKLGHPSGTPSFSSLGDVLLMQTPFVPTLTFTPGITWKHDTNKESLPSIPPPPAPLYSDWMNVSLGVSYAPRKDLKVSATYSYDAFNRSYGLQRVILEFAHPF